jgi:hypothetical protein
MLPRGGVSRDSQTRSYGRRNTHTDNASLNVIATERAHCLTALNTTKAAQPSALESITVRLTETPSGSITKCRFRTNQNRFVTSLREDGNRIIYVASCIVHASAFGMAHFRQLLRECKDVEDLMNS